LHDKRIQLRREKDHFYFLGGKGENDMNTPSPNYLSADI
jgi:hypothetical protein